MAAFFMSDNYDFRRSLKTLKFIRIFSFANDQKMDLPSKVH